MNKTVVGARCVGTRRVTGWLASRGTSHRHRKIPRSSGVVGIALTPVLWWFRTEFFMGEAESNADGDDKSKEKPGTLKGIAISAAAHSGPHFRFRCVYDLFRG